MNQTNNDCWVQICFSARVVWSLASFLMQIEKAWRSHLYLFCARATMFATMFDSWHALVCTNRCRRVNSCRALSVHRRLQRLSLQ